MITAICHQPTCRQHWQVAGLSAAETHEQAEKVLQHTVCPSCSSPITDDQKSAFLSVFDEQTEMERDADVEYWFNLMMGGGPRGLH